MQHGLSNEPLLKARGSIFFLALGARRTPGRYSGTSHASWVRRRVREGPRTRIRRASVHTPSLCGVASRCARSTIVVVVVIPWSRAVLVPALVWAPTCRLPPHVRAGAWARASPSRCSLDVCDSPPVPGSGRGRHASGDQHGQRQGGAENDHSQVQARAGLASHAVISEN